MFILTHNPLVFLPGWGFKASVWEEFTTHFENQDILLLDLPKTRSDDIADVIHELHHQIPANATIIAWSLGGLLATKLCQQYPDRYRQLTLLASTPQFMAGANWPGISEKIAARFNREAETDLAKMAQKFLRLVEHPRVTEFTSDYLAEHMVDFNKHRVDLKRYLHWLFTESCYDNYQKLSMPVLHIFGESDAIVPVAAAIKLANSSPPLQKGVDAGGGGGILGGLKSPPAPLLQKGVTSAIDIKVLPSAGHAFFLTHTPQVINLIQETLHDIPLVEY